MTFLGSERKRQLFSSLVVVGAICLFASNAAGQGCVNARQCSSIFDPKIIDVVDNTYSSGESWLSPRRWQLSVDYRYLHSHRHFVGTEEQHQRATNRSEVNNVTHLFNISGTYEFSPRFNVSVTVPLFFAERYGQSSRNQATNASGIGDMSVVGRMWLLRPPAESRQNISLGIGVKFPTGNPRVVNEVPNALGITSSRVVDQSIQPGDGGYGLVLDFQSYKAIKSTTLYASGVYLVNPRNTNGVPTGRSRPTEAIMSVADQYVGRAGAIFPFPKVRRLVWSMGVRAEGVPVRDLVGRSDGFRRPGYSIDVEPGLIFMRGKDTWSFSVPVAVRRNRTRSVPDILENRHGDAAFADFVILIGYSRHF
jgi:hypothetical protein